jgi:hypothetical protein
MNDRERGLNERREYAVCRALETLMTSAGYRALPEAERVGAMHGAIEGAQASVRESAGQELIKCHCGAVYVSPCAHTGHQPAFTRGFLDGRAAASVE